jgi:isocitrate dehydrogenase (NAD+)
MFALRSIAAPAQRQCMCAAPRATVSFSLKIQRQYSQERVAKFNGKKDANGNYPVSLIEGDGIGPEIAVAVKDIFAAAKVRFSIFR